jgi:hypothetical protein
MDKPIMSLAGMFQDHLLPMQDSRMLRESDQRSAQFVDRIAEERQRHATRINWQQNDLLLRNNMLDSHGCESFGGNRQILIGIARSIDAANVECQP